ncbi:hypothetical protein RRG08_015217 [Elysia crispata]|uniref:Uncharacterized protein n=1 Tax=Elysia crispata TaxID=231223 RepID=A0AAE1DU13_9GAST|nr:hypothetical protein RRG08_015217 [Elysia crispata]
MNTPEKAHLTDAKFTLSRLEHNLKASVCTKGPVVPSKNVCANVCSEGPEVPFKNGCASVCTKGPEVLQDKPTAVIDYTKKRAIPSQNDKVEGKNLAFHLPTLTFILAHILYKKFKKQTRKSFGFQKSLFALFCLSLAVRARPGQEPLEVAAAVDGPATWIVSQAGTSQALPMRKSATSGKHVLFVMLGWTTLELVGLN